MSGVSSVSSSNASLFQYLNSLPSSSNSAGASTSAVENSQLSALVSLLETSGSADAGESASASGASNAGNSGASGAASSSGGSAGVSLANLRTRIETAVTNAVNNLGGSVLTDPGAAAQAVRTAVNTTLQQDGLLPGSSATTPASFGSATPGQSSQVSSGGSGANSSASSASSGASALSASNAESSLLDSLLAQNNVDPTDFQNNLLSSLANQSSNGVDMGQLFQNFPLGQDIDALV